MARALIDFDAACEYLSVKEKTLRALVKPAKPGESPALRAVKIGREWRFTYPDLDAYVATLTSNLDEFDT